MATQRYISTSFWDDSWVHRLDPSEKLLFLYLMTNPLTNIAGIYKLSIDRIVFDTGFNENTIKHILEKFLKAGKVITKGEFMILPSWPKHQKVAESPKIRLGIETILRNTPKDVLILARDSGYCFPVDTLLIGYPYPSNYSDIDLDLDSDIDLSNSGAKAPQTKPAKPISRPTIDDVIAYCKERNNTVDPQKWFDHYTANGWKVGRTTMKDWKAAVRTWERSQFNTPRKEKEFHEMTEEEKRYAIDKAMGRVS